MYNVQDIIDYAKKQGIKLPFINTKGAIAECLNYLHINENVVDILTAFTFQEDNQQWYYIYLLTNENRILWVQEEQVRIFSSKFESGTFELNDLNMQRCGYQTIKKGMFFTYDNIVLTANRTNQWGTDDVLGICLPKGMAADVYKKILAHAKKYDKKDEAEAPATPKKPKKKTASGADVEEQSGDSAAAIREIRGMFEAGIITKEEMMELIKAALKG